MSRLSGKTSRLTYLYDKYRVPFLLKKIDNNKIPEDQREIRLFGIFRNESLRLPHFMKYYFSKGVDRMFLIDNDSTDDSNSICLGHKEVHLFSSSASYDIHWYSIQYLLDKYGLNHWCVVVDIDELIYFPRAEMLSIKDMVLYLESRRFEAMRFLLLDMYSDKSICDTKYQQGEDPLDACPFFDTRYEVEEREFFDFKNWTTFTSIDFRGGVRERVLNKKLPYRLPKISLLKYQKSTYLTIGMHAVNNALISDVQGVTFHTKFLFDFISEAKEESKREQHFNKGIMYKIFQIQLKQNKQLTFYTDTSVRFRNSLQLVKLGLMKESKAFNEFCKQHFNT